MDNKVKTDESFYKAKIADLENELAFVKTALASTHANIEEDFHLRKIIALMPGNVFWKAKNGTFLGINNNLAKLLGFTTPEEIIGKRNHDIIGPEYATALSEIDEKSMNSEGESFEEHGLDAHGHPAIYFTQKHPLYNTLGEVIGIVGISMDITERKKIEHELTAAKERAEASNQAKSQFLAVVNHELRTPLTGILGLVDILKLEPEMLPNKKHIIDDLDNCARYLHSLVNDLLDFTKLDTNKIDLEFHPVNFHELTQEAFSILNELARKKGLALNKQIKHNLPLLLTNGKSFSQILINLINNAIKFTDAGFVNVTIDHEILPNQKIALAMKITDTGLGIPTDKREIIFEPFKQLEDTYVRQSSRSGTGLGLAIVKRLVQLLNCDIYVDSEVGKGSTFTITGEFNIAPCEHPPYHSNALVEEIALSTTPRTQKIKTLLIEDDKIVQLIHRRMLTDLHCDIDLAHCGQEALSLLGQHDIAFVDIGLSDMTGFDLIKNIRQHQEKTQHVFPIIALTGYTGDKEKMACLEAGVDEVAVKPISIKQLGELLEKYC
ncbi:MAG: ATP-binding protein [Gammaproteobacteria bacterium]